MARSHGQRWQDALTFGGRMPWTVGLLLSVTLALSLFVAFGSRHSAPLFELAALVPADVWRGQAWRLVTWPWIEPSPLSLIFTCLFIYWFGKDLGFEWGATRFLQVFGVVVFTAAVGTSLVALVDRAVLDQSYIGGWALTAAMTVAWGLWFPDRVVRIYFVLPIRGYWLAWLTVAVTVIFAVYSGWEHFLPELFAEAAILAWLFRRTLLARWTKMRKASQAEDLLRKRRARSAAHLRVVESLDDNPPDLPPDLEGKVVDLLGKRKPRDKNDLN
jgi:membrane associated rhomboid family serine protease